jgi:tetratricopeptide (TPR) repeat protein
MTYSQYLQANSFVLDITGQVKSSSKALEARVSDQTQALVASNAQLAKQFGSGFDSINCTLEWGFNRLEYILHDVSASIDSLHADFNYSMGLLLEAASTTNRLLTGLLGRLDAIHRTLESPTLTQAREFYRIGCERLSKGLLDKALEAFTDAEKKNDTDFFTQFNLGKLYLYGIDDDDNVLDLQKAKTHLLLASRYAKAEVTVDATFANCAAEALLHASIAAYAQSGEPNVLEDPNRTNQLIDEARGLASDAVRLYPRLSEASYHHAKCCALLGEPTTAITSLETAIAVDRGYAVKVDVDHAFDLIRPHIAALHSSLHDAKRVESHGLLQQAAQLLANLSPWHLEKSTLAGDHYRCQNDLSQVREHINSETYFGFLDAINLLNPLITLLPQLKTKRIEELRIQIEQSMQAARAALPHKGAYSMAVENALQEAHGLLDQAGQQLRKVTYEAFVSALSLAEAANAKARPRKSVVFSRNVNKKPWNVRQFRL